MTSTSTSVILPTFNSLSAFTSPPHQSHMDKLLDKGLEGNVLWEEIDLPATTPSLMDHIVLKSSLDISTIEKITYTTGAPILVGQKWKFNTLRGVKKAKKLKQVQDDTGMEVFRTADEDSSSTPDTSFESWGSQEFYPTSPARKLPPQVHTREPKWALLFNTIYTAMHISYLTCPQRSSIFPFEPKYLEHLPRQWSPEFCLAPILDATNIQRLGLVLHRDVQPKSWVHVLTCVEITESDLGTNHDIPLFKGLITKGYLMMREQPWHRFVVLFSLAAKHLRAHYMDRSGLIITCPILITANPTHLVDMLNTMSLGNSKAHGMDPTMHMCNKSCKQTQCEVGDQAIGWIEDKEKQKLLIIAILWRSQGLFSHGTICYHVWDKDGVEYALKDCWVDEAKKDHEEKVLEMVRGIPNVVTLVATWDVEYEGEPDSTLRIHNRHRKFSPEFRCKYHQRMLLTPCGEPLSTFSTKRELISAFRDLIVTHKAMIRKKVLHGDLSPNNLIIHEGCGFFINFDHTQIITQGSTSVRSPGTGTVPYMSIRLLYAITAIARAKGWGNVMVKHTASDDLKSLFYIFIEFVTSFDGPKGSRTDPRKADRWGEVLEGMGATTTPYKSGLVLVPQCDKELMNRMTTYFGGVRDLVQAWHYKFLDADADQTRGGVTHEEIEGLLNTWVSHAAVDEPHPPEESYCYANLTSVRVQLVETQLEIRHRCDRAKNHVYLSPSQVCRSGVSDLPNHSPLAFVLVLTRNGAWGMLRAGVPIPQLQEK
ncbi:uncharacterized protein EDB91DRAFT_1083357 [Suillus paluster]|uniref:uncharacterized protein n=1 Tax=Suillus paluster TaxID=48578 RepID=UPI001B875FF1|nr:uncharacterized protein EDB91DRAFT_1083357 [Suillus paluster]KAG1736389.1 hypothetical protein EDB91DRAFT_1083357 [Suillus paluster]